MSEYNLRKLIEKADGPVTEGTDEYGHYYELPHWPDRRDFTCACRQRLAARVRVYTLGSPKAGKVWCVEHKVWSLAYVRELELPSVAADA